MPLSCRDPFIIYTFAVVDIHDCFGSTRCFCVLELGQHRYGQLLILQLRTPEGAGSCRNEANPDLAESRHRSAFTASEPFLSGFGGSNT